MATTKNNFSLVPREVIAPFSFRRGSVKWTARSPQLVAILSPLWQTPDAFLAENTALLRDTVLVTLARLPASLSGEEHWLLRRTNYGKPAARVRDLFRRSGPTRAFLRGLDFERAGLPTPRVLAAGIVRRWHKPVKGYLLVEEIRPAETLLEHLRREETISGVVSERVGQAIGRMHERGFTHGDLTIHNVLLDAQRQPWFIDLERARFRGGAVAWDDAIEDFYRFARQVEELGPGARAASLRVVRHYCRSRQWPGREREFATAVLARLRRKVGRNDATARIVPRKE